jgi:electron transfer flavoprotein beta subunit
MSLNIIVTVKQVPDTHNIAADAMKPDGTVNRSALPAIVNPDDLHALEEALKIKERLGASVTAITMGPDNAIEVLKECLYRGADDVILLSDRRFAGSDTLATSYVLKCAIEKVGNYDLVICGHQAIDGDTAQVGPQLAEKLNVNQLTHVSEVVDISEESITVKRSVENGHEIAKSRLPVLLTVTSEANVPRPPSAKRALAFKNLNSKACDGPYENVYLEPDTCIEVDHIKEWNGDAIEADPERCGISGSPTRVKKIENVVLVPGDIRQVSNDEADISEMIRELVDAHIFA